MLRWVAPVRLKHFLVSLASWAEALPEDSGICGTKTFDLREGQTTRGKEFSCEKMYKWIDVNDLTSSTLDIHVLAHL